MPAAAGGLGGAGRRPVPGHAPGASPRPPPNGAAPLSRCRRCVAAVALLPLRCRRCVAARILAMHPARPPPSRPYLPSSSAAARGRRARCCQRAQRCRSLRCAPCGASWRRWWIKSQALSIRLLECVASALTVELLAGAEGGRRERGGFHPLSSRRFPSHPARRVTRTCSNVFDHFSNHFRLISRISGRAKAAPTSGCKCGGGVWARVLFPV